MGKHTPVDPKPAPSVAATLTEAEHDHWLDCPDADIVIRSAAFLLDVIFFSIGSTGIHNLSLAAMSLHQALASALDETLYVLIPLLVLYVSWTIKTVAAVLYFVWAQSRFGGSPAKLLLGLRVVDNSDGANSLWAVPCSEKSSAKCSSAG